MDDQIALADCYLPAHDKGARLTTSALALCKRGNYKPAFSALTMPLPKPLA